MKHTPTLTLTRLALAAGLLASSQLAAAVDFSYSGFGNITAGRVVGDNGPFVIGGNTIPYPDPATWSNCPCGIVDFVHAGVYEKKWSLDTESRLGLQGTLNFSDDLSLTAQGVVRGVAKKAKVNLEWLYLSYNISPKWTIQAGRKRVPLLNYSDFQDVSFAFPWIRVPFDVYGWEITNYNGVNLTFRDDFKGWAVKSNVYAGSEDFKDNPMAKISGPDKQNVNWSGMRGFDLELNRDWFTVRFAVNKSKQHMETVSAADGSVTQNVPADPAYGSHVAQTFSSLSFSADYRDFIGRFELQKISRGPETSYDGTLLSLGYRIGKFTPTIYGTRLAYKPTAGTSNPADTIRGATLRYSLSDTSSLKLQYDRITWNHQPDFTMKRDVATVSYDFVF
ncbi:hypothetical protein RQP53_09675 [Paucibacter sp. APW11]|uniref:Porin n=1 Tax=Roseateles aquae TaxID=3077235 RepID=A0ABU3PAB1_9BURK|nr:hypothetical protein [Paucibacter sp. APW11]MDT8999535.1 hypothetical protein [Paucibacter sp. APW11]